MNKNMKRVFRAMFMVLATVMMLSVPASAASSKTVATIGKKSYTSLEDAVKKVKDGQTIKLKKNVKISEVSSLTLKRNKKYTINLNGHTISGGKILINKGDVTIKNGTLKVSIDIGKKASLKLSEVKGKDRSSTSTAYWDNLGKLTIKSGTYKCHIQNWGTMKIKNGTFNKYAIENVTGKMTIDDGKFSTPSDGSYVNPYVIENNATLTINGGTFKKNGGAALISNSKADLKIKGGTFSSTGVPVVYAQLGGSITISGGTLKSTGANTIRSSQCNITITGGTITCPSNGYYAISTFSTYNQNKSNSGELTLTIKGGNINGNVDLTYTELKMSGGTIKGNVYEDIYGHAEKASKFITGKVIEN